MERPVPSVHPAPHRHVAPDGGAAARRARWLPVSSRSRRCREVDYPTIQIVTFYPGASPDVMASAVTAPLERQFGQLPGLNQMTSNSSEGASIITLQFFLDLNIDVAEQEVQAAINSAGSYLPPRPAEPADLQQDEPGGRADPHARADVDDAAALEGRRLRRHAAGAENLAAARRRSGQHQRRPEARRPRPGQPDGAVVVRPRRSKTCACGRRRANVNQAKGNFDGPHSRRSDRRERSAALERAVPAARRRIQERRARPSARRRQRRRRHRKTSARRPG